MEQLSDFLIEKESELRRHPEFDEVHEDDLNALADFKKSLGIKRVVESSYITEAGTDDRSFSVTTTPSPATAMSGTPSRRGLSSTASRGSRASRRSGVSVQSELSPLYEEDNPGDGGDDDTEASPTPQKRRRLNSSSHRSDSSIGSSITKNTYNRGTILEENEQESDSREESEE